MYEIINPSDKVLVEADDEDVACVAVLLLGEGRYGLRRVDTDVTVLPVFLIGGAVEWLHARGIVSKPTVDAPGLHDWIKAHARELAAVFDSAFYGRESELKALKKALEHVSDPVVRREAVRRYNDEKRSSMNDIGSACAHWAKQMTKIADSMVKA